MEPIIILGSGLAGYTLAREFRKLDAAAPLTIITRDDGSVYSKPMLSNAFAAGKTPAQLATATAEKAALDLNANVLPHAEVIAIDTAAKKVQTTAGNYRYRALVFAIGADPIRPPLGGDAAADVYSVNDLADYARFRAALEPGSEVAILGSGLIGCEFANDLAAAGFAVTVIGPAEYPLQPLIPRLAGDALQQALKQIGVQWRLGRTAVSAARNGKKIELRLDDGSNVSADVVLSAIGLRPRTGLAQATGIAVNRGIVVDGSLRTNDPDIYALGDCAEIEGRVMPFVMPIMHAARALAKTLAGTPATVSFPFMPVAVKTTIYPIVVQPAPAGVDASWVAMEADNGFQLWQIDHSGKLHGFVLTGVKTRQRAAMLAKLEQA
ncbi:MAG TPA: FAD-dependent oxidoreductase [Novimethylophilus sp.]|jgi:rubredoxin-NAD+ reductase|uniref:NAD(P)/FAD-dependent oxidoreductase n=1 Tax=Novimethylophilus sp. TaxID=2137426 RepID=UPI002F3E8F0A